MLNATNLNNLNRLGITVWQPRPSRHPENPIAKTNIVAQHLRTNARCLVLTYAKHDSGIIAEPEQVIFNGMLSVLELATAEVMHATIYDLQPDMNSIVASIQAWQPQTILQLSMEAPKLNTGAPCIQTFSPEYLLHHKQFKPQAYKALLNLRAILHGTS